jgi:branched-subunit amino acid ABC-type transport system permease component
MLLLPQVILDGILIGGVYITIAIGFSLVFGVMHIIDFAVGEWIMLGAFMGYYLNQWVGLDPFCAPAVCFLCLFRRRLSAATRDSAGNQRGPRQPHCSWGWSLPSGSCW